MSKEILKSARLNLRKVTGQSLELVLPTLLERMNKFMVFEELPKAPAQHQQDAMYWRVSSGDTVGCVKLCGCVAPEQGFAEPGHCNSLHGRAPQRPEYDGARSYD
jgi:hypothetical protein